MRVEWYRMSHHHCHSAHGGARPSNCTLSNNERHCNCKKRTRTNSTRHRYATRCPSSLSQHIIAEREQATALSRTTNGTRLLQFLPPLFQISRCMRMRCDRMPRRHCHSAHRGARPSNCALSDNEGHRNCKKRSLTKLCSLAHEIDMLPRAHPHCRSISPRRATK